MLDDCSNFVARAGMARALLGPKQAAGNDAGVPPPDAARTGKALFAPAPHRRGARVALPPDEFAPLRKQVINH